VATAPRTARVTSSSAIWLRSRSRPCSATTTSRSPSGATTAKACLQLLGVLDNRNVRGPLVPLDDDEVAALRAGLEASGLL